MAPVTGHPTSSPTPAMTLSPAQVMAHMLASRAMEPPPGADLKMTLDSPDQIWFLVVAITCIAIPGLFLIVRVYTKLAVVRMFEIADYFIFVAFPLIVVEIVFGYNAVKWGAGVHQWQISFSQLFNQLYWLNVAEITYCPLSFLVKMAILLQYLRLFAPSRRDNKLMWYGAWFCMAGCFVFYAVFMFWTAFYCYPRKMIWDKFSGGTCHDHSPIVMWQGSFNMASDIIILLLPTASLWQLNVPLARKLVITLLFCTGLLACAASAMRVVFTVRIEETFRKADVSHNGFYLGLWTILEVALGFVVACSLSLPRLIQAKGRKVANAVISPFSTLHSVRSTPKGTLTSQTGNSIKTYNSRSLKDTMERSLGSQRVPDMSARQLGKQPVTYEERELQQGQEMHTLRPIPEATHDSSRAPTPAASSQYSSKRNSIQDRNTSPHIQPLYLARSPPLDTAAFPATPDMESHPRHSFHANEYTSASEPWNKDPWSVSTSDLHNLPVRQNSVPPRKPLAPTSKINSRISRWPSKLDTHRSMGLASEPDSTSATDYYTTPNLPQNTFVPMPILGERPLSRWPSKLEHSRSDTPDQRSEWEPERQLQWQSERLDTPTQNSGVKSAQSSQNTGSGEILLARTYSRQTRRLTEERMTIEEIEQEMNNLEQFRFGEVKQSLERARNGSRGRV